MHRLKRSLIYSPPPFSKQSLIREVLGHFCQDRSAFCKFSHFQKQGHGWVKGSRYTTPAVQKGMKEPLLLTSTVHTFRTLSIIGITFNTLLPGPDSQSNYNVSSGFYFFSLKLRAALLILAAPSRGRLIRRLSAPDP